ncbi:MAG TPA: hypothetical protein VNX02_07115 [Steroidobacteraceae bacterium]|jgi:hypothetical protein|nr:hypothetical protein [Steroidobacteraceae bacterium]
MSRCVLPALLAVLAVPVAAADQAVTGEKTDSCLALNNRILGPRAAERPLPLLSGDPTQGFHAACTVPWSKLSPSNQPLPVTDCYRGSLLQVANAAACGRPTGPLWINSRWVVTSAELADTHSHAAFCQQLETGAWAGTRDLKIDCIPQKKELSVDSVPASKASAPSAAGPAPAAAAATSGASQPPAAPATSPPHQNP